MLLTCTAGEHSSHKIKAFLQLHRVAIQAPESSTKLIRKEPEQETAKQHQKPKKKTKTVVILFSIGPRSIKTLLDQ